MWQSAIGLWKMAGLSLARLGSARVSSIPGQISDFPVGVLGEKSMPVRTEPCCITVQHKAMEGLTLLAG